MIVRRIVLALCACIALVGTCPAQGYIQEYVPNDRVMIRLERRCGFASCQAYTVEVDGNGNVTFVGNQLASCTGKSTWKIAPRTVLDLVNEFLRAHFFDAASEYTHYQVAEGGENGYMHVMVDTTTCLPETLLTFIFGDRCHSVRIYDAVPSELGALPDAVDKATESARCLEVSGG